MHRRQLLKVGLALGALPLLPASAWAASGPRRLELGAAEGLDAVAWAEVEVLYPGGAAVLVWAHRAGGTSPMVALTVPAQARLRVSGAGPGGAFQRTLPLSEVGRGVALSGGGAGGPALPVEVR
jgi:hypothetical protein